ncbi:hypothetical protein IC762_12115 [Bradyrhizobium genosp. L]|uniref:hypothetical protein n=1 Tax=Bradyrhizobium genosp. L TaxID=83637 RepID=UPI0018A252DD|nr:hypothetical protein [Bradyrhizobium genosp. L]QPF86989.1 hypothetical protein IC762_12115 [Bradyrhizobium genosp. L]
MTQAAQKTDGSPSPAQVKTTFEWSRDQILIAGCNMQEALSQLIEAFSDGRHSEINLTASFVQKYARQLDGLSTSLIKGCVDQMNRRPRSP